MIVSVLGIIATLILQKNYCLYNIRFALAAFSAPLLIQLFAVIGYMIEQSESSINTK